MVAGNLKFQFLVNTCVIKVNTKEIYFKNNYILCCVFKFTTVYTKRGIIFQVQIGKCC